MAALLHISLYLFMLVSWYTTGTGFVAVLGDVPPLMGYLLSAALQVVLTVSALKLIPRSTIGAVQFPIWVGLYTALAMVSVTFAIGFYFAVFSAKDYGESLFYDAYEKSYRQVSGLFRNLDDLTQRTTELSMMSDRLAAAEIAPNGGGTCQHNRGRGVGPYHHKRSYQAARFQQLRDEFQLARTRAGAQVTKMEALERDTSPVEVKLAELSRLYRAFKADYDQVVGNHYRAELTDHAAWENQGFPDKPEFANFAGAKNACGDSRTVAKIMAVLDVQLPQPPDVDIPRFSPDDRKAVIQLVITEVARTIRGGASGGGSVLGDERYLMPIASGALVDIVILMIAIAIGLTDRHKHVGKGPSMDNKQLAGLYRALSQLPGRYRTLLPDIGGDRLPETAAAAAELLQTILRPVAVTVGSRQHLFLPSEHVGGEQLLSPKSHAYLALVSDIVQILTHYHLLGRRLGPTTEFCGWTLMEATGMIGLGPADLGANGYFHVYPVKAELAAMLVRASSDTTDIFAQPSGWLSAFLHGAGLARCEGLPSTFVGDREFYARQVHGRLRKMTEGWELELHPASAEVDRMLYHWLRDDDDGMSRVVEERPHSLLRPGTRRFHFDGKAKRKIEELVVTTERVVGA
ncbi:MAG: hypothetical protein HYU59_04935 [Magnetospirillum gryphiswaldense]|nr:hypothetical protein [Magnetospirillum gryphiswaldense]